MNFNFYSISAQTQVRSDYDIFISYSRRDKLFVQQLYEALTQANQRVWVDLNDIPPLGDWWQEIQRGIESANNFLFVISSNSVSSEECSKELTYAIEQGKRLIPVVKQDVNYEQVHPELARINWIFFQEASAFEAAFKKLITAIVTDLDYVRSHTRLIVRAKEWKNKGHSNSYLLRGDELTEAEQWLSKSQDKQPSPTDLHQKYIYTSRQVEVEQQKVEMHLHRLTPQQVKNRNTILNKVKKFWVEGVLCKSLHEKVLIEIGLEERLDDVAPSWNIELEITNTARQPLPKGTKVVSIFDQMGEGRTLLILGEPGAGKTTTLLELTQDLVNRAEQGLDHRIPVVFNLSSWAAKKQSIAEWLVDELNSKYQVSKQTGQEWLKHQNLLLLLDGLDEVKLEIRDSCVAELNTFYQDYGPEMVVCSRIKDYEALKNRLNFQSAIYLRSLTTEQAQHYLNSINADLSGLKALIDQDEVLQELATSPLMLNIMVFTYQGVSLEKLPQNQIFEERRKQLFDAYIKKMFRRPTRLKVQSKYSEVQTKRWLAWLAQRLVQESQTVFLIERMQPAWLQTNTQRSRHILVLGLIGILIGGLGGVLTVGAILGLSKGLVFAIISGIGGAIFSVLAFGLISKSINPVTSLKWSWQAARNSIKIGMWIGLLLGVLMGVVSFVFYSFILTGMIDQTYGELREAIISGFSYGIGTWLIFILIRGLTGSTDIEISTFPNQGIWRSVQNTGFFVLISVLALSIVTQALGLPILNGITLGTLIGLSMNGEACMKHFALRLVLFNQNLIPWNYSNFLDYATDRILLQKVGGGYIFIHRLLLEHFAKMEIEK